MQKSINSAKKNTLKKVKWMPSLKTNKDIQMFVFVGRQVQGCTLRTYEGRPVL